MSKIKKFSPLRIIKGSKKEKTADLINKFITSLKLDPKKCLTDSNEKFKRWCFEFEKEKELEIILEKGNSEALNTIYMGLNVCLVPLKDLNNFLLSALEIADGLIGLKVSIVGHHLVLSTCIDTFSLTVKEIEYYYQMMLEQEIWYIDQLIEHLDLDYLQD